MRATATAVAGAIAVVLASRAAGAISAAETLRRDHVDAARLAKVPADASLAELIKALGDPWTRVLDAANAKAFLPEVSGKAHVGVGLPELLSIDVDARSGAPVIVTPLPGSPAARAGLLPGDRVTSIDRTPTDALPFGEVVRKLRGPAGTEVRLSVQRGGATRELTLRRTELPAEGSGVEAEVVGRVLHLCVRRFGETTPDAVAAVLARYPRIPVVLDLRENPGGALDSALQVAGLFVGRVDVAEMQTSHGTRKLSGKRVALGRRRVAVVVDEATASAAELLTVALSSVSRAKVIGAPTVGKCLVHTVAQLDEGGLLLFTVGRVRSLEGRSICEGGVPIEMPERGRDAQLRASLRALSR
jgi:carboxyl-terminal processing protease